MHDAQGICSEYRGVTDLIMTEAYVSFIDKYGKAVMIYKLGVIAKEES